MTGALAGLRVVDCARLIAGGVLATILADHGADVLKIENPRGGDPLRTWLRDRGELWWKVYARGKRSITLDLAKVRMTAPTPRLGETPATIRWAGQPLGAHNHEVYGELGLDKAELEELAREGII